MASRRSGTRVIVLKAPHAILVSQKRQDVVDSALTMLLFRVPQAQRQQSFGFFVGGLGTLPYVFFPPYGN